jgi:ribosomal protein S8
MVKLIYSCLSLINQGLKQKSKFIILSNTKDNYIICKYLFENNWISQFYKIGEYRLIIYFKYYSNNPIMHSIKIISKPGLKRSGKLIYLKNFKYNNSYRTDIVLQTSNGLISIHNAIKNNISGKLLFRIN